MSAEVRVEEREGIPVAYVGGDVDMLNAAEVFERLASGIPNSAPGLVVDLSATTYLDSRGVHVLIQLGERLTLHGQRFRLVVPPVSVVRRVLQATHVDERVPLDDTVADALERLRA